MACFLYQVEMAFKNQLLMVLTNAKWLIGGNEAADCRQIRREQYIVKGVLIKEALSYRSLIHLL